MGVLVGSSPFFREAVYPPSALQKVVPCQLFCFSFVAGWSIAVTNSVTFLVVPPLDEIMSHP